MRNKNGMTVSCGGLRGALTAGVAFFATLTGFTCGFQWWPYGGYFSGCDDQGFVWLTERLANLEIPGEESSVQIWAFFHSNHTSPSPYAGMWRIGILDMSLVQTGENQFRMTDPGGNETVLSRNAKDKSVLEGSGWKGNIANDRVKLWASCGWSVEFNRGKISKMNTSHNKTLTFNYADGLVTSITCDGKPLVTVSGVKGDTLEMTVNGKKISIARVEQPIVQRMGNANKVVGGGVKSLSRVVDQETGAFEYSYTYSVDGETRPMIVAADRNDARSFTIVWDPKTRKILRYNDWEYTKTRDRKNPFDTIELVRTNSAGVVESRFRDIAAGIDIVQNGASKRSEYTFTSGPAAGKVRKIEDMLDGKVTNIQQYFYDEKGRVIRGKENEDTLRFEYDDKNRTATAMKNGKLLWKKQMDAENRILKVEYPGGKELRLKYHGDRPAEAELVSGGVSVAVQMDADGLVKDGTAVFKNLPNVSQ